MNLKYLFGISAGPPHWTLLPLSIILKAQANFRVMMEQPPVLPWANSSSDGLLQRVKRNSNKEGICCDLAGFSLPHLKGVLQSNTDIQVIHVTCDDKHQLATEFEQYLDQVYALPTNHWSLTSPRWDIDPIKEMGFPKYESLDRREAIFEYISEYESLAESIYESFPKQILDIDREQLFKPDGVARVLDFLGVPQDQRKFIGPTPGATPSITPHPRLGVRSVSHRDPQRCCILVPFPNYIEHETELVLRELEERGYPVHRQHGVSAIDQARNRMATEAIINGFEETLWVDSDMVFTPDCVEKIRSHQELIVSGLYSKRGGKAFASVLKDSTQSLTLGHGGGLVQVKYAATGFLLVRRKAYIQIQQKLQLPICNELFKGLPLIPFFQPLIIDHEESQWYLGEDYAFSERASRAGLSVFADTSLRLWHIGDYHYGWEDVAWPVRRNETLKINCDIGLESKTSERSNK